MNLRDFMRTIWKTGDTPQQKREQQPELRRELREVRLAFEVDEDFDKAISLARPFLESSDDELRIQARRHTALSLFRKNNYSQALSLFRELAENSNEAGEWFNVVTSATLAGDIAGGEDAFEKAVKCQEVAGYSQQPSVPFMRHWYACALQDRKEYAKALHQIEELRTIYEQLKITDDTFVYIRGVPFFSHTMNVAVDVFRGLGSSFNAIGWIEAFARKLDEEGQTYLAEVKTRLMEDNGTD
jgi:tetratricopeptide (TPR) repeat protein